jgi:arylsulfatase A
MIKYMDKMIGKVITKLKNAGLSNNTVIIFTSDNGTGRGVQSLYKGRLIRGKKLGTTRTSINVPLIVYGPGNVLAGKTDTALIDFTDFLPTLANAANISKPTTWGRLDGKTFYDNAKGNTNRERKHVYCYWPTDPNPPNPIGKDAVNITSFIFNYNYKLYDSAHGYRFYNIRNDVHERTPLITTQLNAQEKLIRTSFKQILDSCIKAAK